MIRPSSPAETTLDPDCLIYTNIHGLHLTIEKGQCHPSYSYNPGKAELSESDIHLHPTRCLHFILFFLVSDRDHGWHLLL